MKSLNKVLIIGNATRDPELHQTNGGIDVCTLGLATDRSWKTEAGEKREEAQFHQVICWGKLAVLACQLVHKGGKVYIEGRLQTRTYEKDGQERSVTEIIANELIALERRADPAVAELAA